MELISSVNTVSNIFFFVVKLANVILLVPNQVQHVAQQTDSVTASHSSTPDGVMNVSTIITIFKSLGAKVNTK